MNLETKIKIRIILCRALIRETGIFMAGTKTDIFVLVLYALSEKTDIYILGVKGLNSLHYLTLLSYIYSCKYIFVDQNMFLIIIQP